MKITIQDNTNSKTITIYAIDEETNNDITIEFRYNAQNKYSLLKHFLESIEKVDLDE